MFRSGDVGKGWKWLLDGDGGIVVVGHLKALKFMRIFWFLEEGLVVVGDGGFTFVGFSWSLCFYGVKKNFKIGLK